MRATVLLQNVKSSTPIESILNHLNLIKGISNTALNPETKELTFDYTTHNAFEGIRESVKALGFPFQEHNTPSAMNCKSDFNCSIGKVYS